MSKRSSLLAKGSKILDKYGKPYHGLSLRDQVCEFLDIGSREGREERRRRRNENRPIEDTDDDAEDDGDPSDGDYDGLAEEYRQGYHGKRPPTRYPAHTHFSQSTFQGGSVDHGTYQAPSMTSSLTPGAGGYSQSTPDRLPPQPYGDSRPSMPRQISELSYNAGADMGEESCQATHPGSCDHRNTTFGRLKVKTKGEQTQYIPMCRSVSFRLEKY